MTTGKGSPTGIAWAPRGPRPGRPASSQSAESSSVGRGLAEQGRAEQPAGAVDADDARRLGRRSCRRACGPGRWQTSSVPQRPSRSVAVPPWLRDLGGDLRARLGPQVAVARSREGPQLDRAVVAGQHHGLDGCRWPRRPGAAARGRPPGSMQQRAEVDALGRRRRGGRRRRRDLRGSRPRRRGRRRPRPGRCPRPRTPRTCDGTSLHSSGRGGAGTGEPSGRTVTPGPTRDCRGVRRPRRTRARSTRWTTSWATRSPRRSVDRLVRVVVDQQHLDLAAVARVDGARGVDDREPVPGRQPRARVHQRDVARRERERDPGRHQGTAPPARA